jgi:hypothetical protein
MLIERSDNGAGWAVAAVIIIAVLAVGAFVWARYYSAPAAQPATTGSSINVSLPSSDTGSTGGTQSSGATQSSGGSATPAPTTGGTQTTQ